MRTMRTTFIITSISVTVAFLGCSTGYSLETAQDLANALAAEGIAYDATEPLDPPPLPRGRIDEILALNGEGLRVEIMRVEDRRIFDIAKSAVGLLVLGEAVAGQKFKGRPDVVSRYPFAVVIRGEPEPGMVRDALSRILPPEEET
jgi:hypothetical protein